MKTFLLAVLCCISLLAKTQISSSYSIPFGYFSSSSGLVGMYPVIAATNDGGVITAGQAYKYDDWYGWQSSSTLLLERIGSGNTIGWQKRFDNSHIISPSLIYALPTGDFILAGLGFDSSGNAIFIDTLSPAGDIKSEKNVGNPLTLFKTIKVTPGGGFIIAGQVYMNGNYDAAVVKLNAQYEVEWKKYAGGSGDDDLTDIQVTEDGFLAIGATSSNNGDVNGNHGGFDAWVVKLNSGGDIVWQKCFGGSLDESGNSITATPDSGFIFAGDYRSTDGDLAGKSPTRDAEMWCVKVDPMNNIQWQKSFKTPNGSTGVSVAVCPNGGYAFAGNISATKIVRFDANGKAIWTKNYYNIKTSRMIVSQNKIVIGLCYYYSKYTGDEYGYESSAYSYINTINDNTTLPVTFQNFTAQKQQSNALLKWQTATELNSKQFNVQRSLDGTMFTTIGTVKAAGSSTVLMQYDYVDNAALKISVPMLYYRIEEVDNDGHKTYSKVATLTPENNTTQYMIAPNPVHSTINIRSTGNVKAMVRITDMAGLVLYSSTETFTTGSTTVIPAARLANGIYMVTITDGKQTKTIKLVKQ